MEENDDGHFMMLHCLGGQQTYHLPQDTLKQSDGKNIWIQKRKLKENNSERVLYSYCTMPSWYSITD